MLKRIMLLVAAVLLVLPAGAMAAFQAGDSELTLFGTGSSDNSFDSNTFNMQLGYGMFFSDMLEGVIRQDLGIVVRDNAGDDWNASTAVGADLNFDMAAGLTPFVGGTVGYLYGDNVNNTWFAAPEGGVKFFANPTTFIQALVQYQWLFDNSDEATDNFDDGRFVYGLGIGFKW